MWRNRIFEKLGVYIPTHAKKKTLGHSVDSGVIISDLFSSLCFFLLYGSLSGKEQTPAICTSSTMRYRCYHQRIQNIKAHCFFYSWGVTGEMCIVSPLLSWSLPFYLYQLSILLKLQHVSVNVFLSFGDNLQLEPFAEQYQVTAMAWEMIENVTNWCTNV